MALWNVIVLESDVFPVGTQLVTELETDPSGRPPERVAEFVHPHGKLEGPFDLTGFDSDQRTASYAPLPAPPEPVFDPASVHTDPQVQH